MAILFDWYEDPKPSDKKENEKTLHPRIKEIDLRLTNYFKTHQFLRRTDFQSLCGMVRSTAMRHLRRLRSEKSWKMQVD